MLLKQFYSWFFSFPSRPVSWGNAVPLYGDFNFFVDAVSVAGES